jgi:hypothetical protein
MDDASKHSPSSGGGERALALNIAIGFFAVYF